MEAGNQLAKIQSSKFPVQFPCSIKLVNGTFKFNKDRIEPNLEPNLLALAYIGNFGSLIGDNNHSIITLI